MRHNNTCEYLGGNIQTFCERCAYVPMFRHMVYPIHPVTANDAKKTVNFMNLAPANTMIAPPMIAAAHRACTANNAMNNVGKFASKYKYEAKQWRHAHMNIQPRCRRHLIDR